MTIAEQIWQEARVVVEKEAKRDFALKLIDDGFDVDRIVRYTGLKPEQVKQLKNGRPTD